MPAYLVVYQEGPIHDTAEMDEYHRQTRAMNNDIAPTPLVIFGAVHGLEGTAPEGVVILQFATVEEAKAWYNNPDYQAALPHRLKAADYRTIIVEGM